MAKQTIRGWCEEYLYERGMFEDQAKDVVAQAEASPAMASMAGRWDQDVSGYPAPLFKVLSISLDREALAWIDRECPEAWFRDVFDRTKDPAGGAAC